MSFEAPEPVDPSDVRAVAGLDPQVRAFLEGMLADVNFDPSQIENFYALLGESEFAVDAIDEEARRSDVHWYNIQGSWSVYIFAIGIEPEGGAGHFRHRQFGNQNRFDQAATLGQSPEARARLYSELDDRDSESIRQSLAALFHAYSGQKQMFPTGRNENGERYL